MRPRDECLSLSEVDSDEKIVSFVINNMQQVLEETYKTLDREQLFKAIDLLHRAKFVKVVGLGGSSVVARHAQHYLRKVGLHVTLFSAYELGDAMIEQYTKDDVVIAVSYSGNNPFVVDIVRDAKRKGASIIGITSYGENNLQQLADVPLISSVGGKGIINGYRAIERTTQLAIVDMIFTGLSLKRKQIGQSN